MSKNSSQQDLSLLSVLVGIVVAGITAMILSLLITQFNWPELYSSLIPVSLAIPVGMLSTYSWQKGVKNLTRNDYTTSIMAGIGAAVGLLTAEIFL
ncbi:MAG: hypothetical protein F6K00_32765 [Leptolyngbya sp. SIOISBB]|nr:hypothetical protein [Leptolyngbya sp. SIOISBB]